MAEQSFDWEQDFVPVETAEQGFDWGRDFVPAQEKPDALDAVASGFSRGALKGWTDEVGGLIGKATLRESDVRKPEDPTNYQLTRNAIRRSQDAAAEEHPWLSGLSQVAGDVASDALLSRLGVPVGTTAYQTAAGALMGAGESDSDVATEGAGDMLLGAGVGGVVSAATSGIGRLASPLLGKARGAIQRRIGEAVGDQATASARAAEKAVRSASGAVGGETSAGNRMLEVMQQMLTDPAATSAQKEAAQTFLESEAGLVLRRGVNEGILEKAPGQLGRIEAAKAALGEAQGAATPEAIQAAIDEGLKSPVRRQVLPKVAKYVARGLPALATGYVGGEIGGTEGALIGGGLGAVAGTIMGKPGTALANMVRNPGVRKAAWETLEAVLVDAPQKLGKYAQPLLRALSRGKEDYAATYFSLMHQDPEAREMLTTAADSVDEEAAPAR